MVDCKSILFYNGIVMNTQNMPEFYTGTPVDADDLRFRDDFLAELWETLGTKHVLLTAPLRVALARPVSWII